MLSKILGVQPFRPDKDRLRYDNELTGKRGPKMTYAANKILGHTNGINTCTWWITGPVGIMEIKGWNFVEGKVV
jgi:hypothetical protein